jgi:hypothetical protein
MATQAGTRLAYEKAKAAVQAAGFSIDQAVLSQSYLRSEVLLTTGKTSYQFPILINDNSQPVTNTSQLLNLQDAFYVSQLFIGFAKPSSATSSEFKLNTYPDTTIFSTANTAQSLYSFYNGFLQLTVNNRQIVSAYNISRHMFVGQTQGITNSTAALSTIAQQDGATDGFYPIEPGLVLVGSKQNVLTVNIPQALTAVEANSRAVIIFSGHLAQNVTPVR